MTEQAEPQYLPLQFKQGSGGHKDRLAGIARTLVEFIVRDLGPDGFLERFSDPVWFRSFAAVFGADLGLATALLGTLKEAVNPVSTELGLYFCGGRGTFTQRTARELFEYSRQAGLNGEYLVRCSKLASRIDHIAIQDGFQVFLHTFLVSRSGQWASIQQGMNGPQGQARRYHWHSEGLKSFVEEPHTGIVGQPGGRVLNLTDPEAGSTREGMLRICREIPEKITDEIRLMVLPGHPDLSHRHADLERLGSVLSIAHQRKLENFEDFMLLGELGPKTLRTLALVSEVRYGTPTRFRDPAGIQPARYLQGENPLLLPSLVFEEHYDYFRQAIDRSVRGRDTRAKAVRRLERNLTQRKRKGPADKQLSLSFA